MIAGAVAVVLIVAGARFWDRVPARRRRGLLVVLLVGGAVALAALAAVEAAEAARTAARALGAVCLAYAAWRLR